MNRDFVAVVLLFTLLFAGLYEGAYYLAISDRLRTIPDDIGPSITLGSAYIEREDGKYDITPVYACGEPVAGYAFAPAHWLDRRIRPDVWTTPFDERDLNFAQLPFGTY